MKNWNFTIKTAAPAMYHADRNVQSTNIELDLAKKFFNFMTKSAQAPGVAEEVTPDIAEWGEKETKKEIKHENEHTAQLIPLYHSTKAMVAAKMDDWKMLSVPDANRSQQREQHASNQFQIFCSRSKSYAQGSYSGSQDGAVGCTMVFRTPLYTLNEVRQAIFNPYMMHPYTYNEQNHHKHLAKIIQPALSAIKRSIESAKPKERKSVEKKEFTKLLKKVNSYVINAGSRTDSKCDEWTPVNGIQERFFDDCHFQGGGILGKSTYKEVVQAYKTDQNFKQKFIQLLKTHPYYSFCLSIEKDWVERDKKGHVSKRLNPLDEKAYEEKRKVMVNGKEEIKSVWVTPRDILRQAWPDWVSANPSARISYMPEKYLHDTKPVNVPIYKKGSNDWNHLEPMTDPTTGKVVTKKIPISNWVRENFISIYDKNLLAVKSYDELSGLIGRMPFLVQVQMIPQIRQAILKMYTPTDAAIAGVMANSLYRFQPLVFKDPGFMDQLTEQLFSKLDPHSLWSMFKWSGNSPDSLSDQEKFRPTLVNNPTLLKLYISKVPPGTVVWNRWDTKLLEKLAPLIKERIKESIQKDGIASILPTSDSKYGPDHGLPVEYPGQYDQEYNAGLMSMPSFLIDESIMAEIEKKAIEEINTDFDKFTRLSLKALPPSVSKQPSLKAAIIHKLETDTVSWSSWDSLPPDITTLPQLQEKKQESQILNQDITLISFDELKTPSLIEAYIKKACEYIRSHWAWYNTLNKSLKKDPRILEATAKGYVHAVEFSSYWQTVKEFDKKIYEMPEFEPFRDIIDGISIRNNYSTVNYKTLKPGLKKIYMEKLAEVATSDPEMIAQLVTKDLAEEVESPDDAVKQAALQAQDAVWENIAKGIGVKAASHEYNNTNSIFPLPPVIANAPIFQKHIEQFHKVLLNNNCINSIDYNLLSVDLKPKYKTAAKTQLTINPLLFEKIAKYPELANDADIIKSLSFGYWREYGQVGVPASKLSESFSQAVEPHKKAINDYLINQGSVSGFFINHMDPEQQANYKKNIITRMTSYPEEILTIDPILQKDPEVFRAAALGYEARYGPHMDSYAARKDIPEDVSKLANEIGDPVAKKAIDGCTQKIKDYWIKGLEKGEHTLTAVMAYAPPCAFHGDLCKILIEQLKNGKIFSTGFPTYYSDQEKLASIKSYLSIGKFPPDMLPQLTEAFDIGSKQIQLKVLVDEPYRFQGLTTEEKAKIYNDLIPLIQDKVNNTNSFQSLLQLEIILAPIIKGKPEEALIKSEIEKKAIGIYNTAETPSYEESYDNLITWYGKWSPTLTEIANLAKLN
jgi:hypothetical protein